MKYVSSKQFTHKQPDKIGVLITNLGTPDAPTKQALKPYLKQFLSDPRVVEFPRLLWWIILNGIILNVRPAKSAEAYASVWSDEGSPLLVHTKNQAAGIAQYLQDEYGDDVVVSYAMRYGNPSIGHAMNELFEQGARKLLVLPLYPQYSGATTGSTFDAIADDLKARRWIPELRFVNQYLEHPLYIKAVANKIRSHWAQHGQPEKLIFSYHGVPKRYLLKGDPYHCQCHKTTRLIADELELEPDQFMTTFQSRFGREEWLKPYTDETLKGLPKQGISSIQVVCPGFSADCLETIEEIDEENREYFIQNGGKEYSYIEALNSDPAHIELLVDIIKTQLNGWHVGDDYQAREQRALALGAEK